jgi:23S rRNA (pseudouridine1915-N3)-methyltransferase
MQIVIAAVGRAKRSAEAELVTHYLKQTRWDVVVKELPDAPANMAPDARRAREAEAFGKLLGPGARLIAMDACGKNLSSEGFAKLIQDAQKNAIKHAVFAIGGQDGLDAALVKRAHATIAFGAVTWPHQLLRAMLAEQIYRAYTITAGHPYHIGH